ncbi:MAG: DUF1592 domain-containing protein [Vicinamibacterales bacterium]
MRIVLAWGLAAVVLGTAAGLHLAAQEAQRKPAGGRAAAPVVGSRPVVAAPRAAAQAQEPVSGGGPSGFRRLNEGQYKRSIAQIFGADIKVPGRFEPPVREDGMLAIGDSKVVVTPSGLEQNVIRSREISAQVLDDKHRSAVAPCAAPSASAFDDACAKQVLLKYGRLLFRRPLTENETTAVMKEARYATEKSRSFLQGLQAGLGTLMVSPAFVFRIETTEPEPARRGSVRLDAFSLATRVSFLLWDAPPDGDLLDAAERGGLQARAGLEKQVARMMASPKFEQGVRAFFSDMLSYEQFDGLAKDTALFPIFSPQLRTDAMEQTLRTIVDHLLTQQKDYRDLFTTKKTFLSRSLGALYGVGIDYRGFDGWMPYTFPADAPQAGVLTLPGFLMLDPSHEGKSSPTIRGKKLRELFLCQRMPDPPANVEFTDFQDPRNPMRTVRQRLSAHARNPVCASCHSMMDPLGLSMENFDAVGQYRTKENDVSIDASGVFERKKFDGLVGLSKVLTESPALAKCAVQRVYEYGTGRPIAPGEKEWVAYANQQFAAQGYRFPQLIRAIATSQAFQAVSSDSPASNPKD